MNQSEHTRRRHGARTALHCLYWALLPLLGTRDASGLPRSSTVAGLPSDEQAPEPAPYLPVVGSLPLRFQRPSPPPGVLHRPTAGGPPIPALSPTETTVAVANSGAIQSAALASRASDEPSALEVKPAAAGSPPKAAPPRILQDDTRRAIRPEDFLPYFQAPGASGQPGGVNVIVPVSVAPAAPVPGTLPASSASYTQSPK